MINLIKNNMAWPLAHWWLYCRVTSGFFWTLIFSGHYSWSAGSLALPSPPNRLHPGDGCKVLEIQISLGESGPMQKFHCTWHCPSQRLDEETGNSWVAMGEAIWVNHPLFLLSWRNPRSWLNPTAWMFLKLRWQRLLSSEWGSRAVPKTCAYPRSGSPNVLSRATQKLSQAWHESSWSFRKFSWSCKKRTSIM